jgi:hypothetical protein
MVCTGTKPKSKKVYLCPLRTVPVLARVHLPSCCYCCYIYIEQWSLPPHRLLPAMTSDLSRDHPPSSIRLDNHVIPGHCRPGQEGALQHHYNSHNKQSSISNAVLLLEVLLQHYANSPINEYYCFRLVNLDYS